MINYILLLLLYERQWILKLQSFIEIIKYFNHDISSAIAEKVFLIFMIHFVRNLIMNRC